MLRIMKSQYHFGYVPIFKIKQYEAKTTTRIWGKTDLKTKTFPIIYETNYNEEIENLHST